MTYEDFETKMEAKGWVPTPREMVESLKTVQTGPDQFEATPPEISDHPIWDELTTNFDPDMALLDLENHIEEHRVWWEEWSKSFTHVVNNMHSKTEQLAITHG